MTLKSIYLPAAVCVGREYLFRSPTLPDVVRWTGIAADVERRANVVYVHLKRCARTCDLFQTHYVHAFRFDVWDVFEVIE